MATLPRNEDPDLLVGYAGSDDAAVYRLDDETALVTTADIITPPVDDPFLYGQIAAANAISDVYAMGGKPLTCLNLVCFPAKKLPPDILHQIVAGALSKITEAGAVLAGGHSIDDDEPKFGLSVTGVVHPDNYWSNGGAQPGDILILTKPIGSGVLFNANLKGWVSERAMDECCEWLTILNRTAFEVMRYFDIHAATDISGFGLAGHGLEMASASRACLVIDIDRTPVMKEALQMYQKGITTGVNPYNRQMVAKKMRIEKDIPPWHTEIFYDPQTSGGLLVAVAAEQADEMLTELHRQNVTGACVIGRVDRLKDSGYLLFR